ncbi:MBL fold metallo-hydrolase [Rhodovibrio salinarum]|nr:MBL fold metallo-hydrolase [Rhodovibrio salinarum]
MQVRYDILVQGNSLALADGFLGLSSVVLLHTQAGPVLFDTGHHATKRRLLTGLARHGLKSEDVAAVILSHLHFDHANNLELFPHAQVYVSAAECAYARDPHPDDLYVPGHLLGQLEAMETHLLEAEGEIVPGVRWLASPGHTPGLIALVLDDTPQGRVVLASDAIKTAKEALERCCDLAFDPAARGSASIARLLDLAPDRLVPGHFPEMRRTAEGWTWDAAEVPLLIR